MLPDNTSQISQSLSGTKVTNKNSHFVKEKTTPTFQFRETRKGYGTCNSIVLDNALSQVSENMTALIGIEHPFSHDESSHPTKTNDIETNFLSQKND